jgi:hypothetical protein
MPTAATPGLIGEDSRVCRTSQHFKAEQDGETVIMSVAAGKFFTFDAIGLEIWDAVAVPCRVGTVIDALALEHRAARATVAQDVIAFLDRLAEAGLLDLA